MLQAIKSILLGKSNSAKLEFDREKCQQDYESKLKKRNKQEYPNSKILLDKAVQILYSRSEDEWSVFTHPSHIEIYHTEHQIKFSLTVVSVSKNPYRGSIIELESELSYSDSIKLGDLLWGVYKNYISRKVEVERVKKEKLRKEIINELLGPNNTKLSEDLTDS